MKITINNIGKVKEAEILISGITVIAGENDTGKSTIGKTLFSIFNSFFKVDNLIKIQRQLLIRSKLNKMLIEFFAESEKVIEILDTSERKIKDILDIIIKLQKDEINVENIKELIFKNLLIPYQDELLAKEEELDKKINEIVEILNLDNKYIFKNYLQNNLNIEFNNQIQNLYTSNLESKIKLEITKKETEILIRNQKVEEITSIFDLLTRAVYIDDPFIIDKIGDKGFIPRGIIRNNVNIWTHGEFLEYLLRSEKKEKNIVSEALFNSKIENILKKLENVFHGAKVNYNEKKIGYVLEGVGEPLDIRNLSAGIKTFAILKILIEKGILEENGTLILDEPEIHLHPEWQLIFAEIIVILQKQLGLHILLTTHSPYFLRAIQVFAGKYEIADKCKYYLASNEVNCSVIKDVTDNIDSIYKKLSLPFQKLEDLLYENY